MKMGVCSIAAILATGILSSSAALALQDSSRGSTWEGAFRISNVQGDTYASEGSKAETDNSAGFGFGFGYNVNENLTLSGNFNWADIDYDALVQPAAGNGNAAFKAKGTIETSTLSFNGTYNILRKSFTPFVSAGVGATYVDTNVPNGPPLPVCWYDPWYGYYCGTIVPTKEETDFSYNLGAGVRWDVSDSFFLKVAANKLWLDASGNIGHPTFVSYSIDFGIRFW